MDIAQFELERYFAKHEFTAKHLLSCSDCEALSLQDILGMADPESMELWNGLKLGYTETPGHPLLRTEIAGLYKGIEADNVLVAAPEELIFLFMHTVLKPGDHVICTFPGYQSLYEIARSIGCEVTAWVPDEDDGWRFGAEQLEQDLRPETRLVVANFPHNPTGYVPSQNEYRHIFSLLREKGAYFLSDEMYRFLEHAPAETLPSACELYERAFSLFGLSKTFGLPGLRIGWMSSKTTKVLTRMAGLKDYTTICSSAPSEILAIMALRNREKIIAGCMDLLNRNLAVLDDFFEKHKDKIAWNRPRGGSIGFPRLKAGPNSETFCEDLIHETGIMLVPSSIFHFGDAHVRFGFGRKNLPEVIGLFSGYLDKME